MAAPAITATDLIVLNTQGVKTRFCLRGTGFDNTSRVSINDPNFQWDTEILKVESDATCTYLIVQVAFHQARRKGRLTGEVTVTVANTDPTSGVVQMSIPQVVTAFYDTTENAAAPKPKLIDPSAGLTLSRDATKPTQICLKSASFTADSAITTFDDQYYKWSLSGKTFAASDHSLAYTVTYAGTKLTPARLTGNLTITVTTPDPMGGPATVQVIVTFAYYT
jgi:hypothetical protein